MMKFVTIALAVALALSMGMCAANKTGGAMPANAAETVETVREFIGDIADEINQEISKGIGEPAEEINEAFSGEIPPMLGGMVGGWTPAVDPAITEDIQALFDKATEGLLGMNYVPVALLGTQVVAGQNVAVLCQGAAVVPNAVPSWKVMFINEDPEGNTSILNIADFDFWTLCTYGAAD